MRLLLVFISFVSITQLVAQTPGEIKDTVRCRANAQQYYALYLPRDYSASNNFPLILFFDPAGRGQEPLKQYKALADRYNFVLACSYKSRNGSFQLSSEAAYSMMVDIRERFSINSSVILVSGFSGGARLASFLAIKDTQFMGVIACGATFASENKISSGRKIPYAIVTGDRDMNFLESINTARYLEEIYNPYVRVEYNGIHRWPSAVAYEQALVWHLLQKKLLDKEHIDQGYHTYLASIKSALDSSNWFMVQEQAERTLNLFREHVNVDKADSMLALSKAQHNHEKEKKNLEKIWKQEEGWRNQFYDRYNKTLRAFDPDTAYKENEWTFFQKEITHFRSSRDKDKKRMGDRLFDFSWRICAEQGGQFFEQKDYKHSLLDAKIWSAMAPDDYRPWIMLAKVQAAQGLNKESLRWLKKAFEKGFRNKAFLENDPAFASLCGTTAYKELAKQF
jgi:predicted esterase